jgi:hypothetical protein
MKIVLKNLQYATYNVNMFTERVSFKPENNRLTYSNGNFTQIPSETVKTEALTNVLHNKFNKFEYACSLNVVVTATYRQRHHFPSTQSHPSNGLNYEMRLS